MLKKLVLVFVLILVASTSFDIGEANAQDENGWVRRVLRVERWRQRRAEIREREILEERRREAERRGDTRVYGYTRRLAEEREHCILNETHATSVLSDSENGAMNSAKLNWGAMVRAEMGERYMDIEMAVDVRHRCYRASTNETLLGKAAESLTGAFQWRCEIKARACRPGWNYERAERR